MDSKTMGEFLIKLRKEQNLTQKDISLLCNVSTQAVSKWERGESVPDIEILEKLSILYRISINELISGEKKVIYLDIEKRRKIISLTFSVLAFFAYFLYFLKLSDMNLMLKGYEVIFNGTGGNSVILTWIVFLILVSYLILNIFILTKVIISNSKIEIYYLLSCLTIYFISLYGLLFNFYVLFPQVIIIIVATVNFTMGFTKEALKTWFPRARYFIRTYIQDLKKTKIEIKSKRQKGEDLSNFKIAVHKHKILYNSFYVILFLFFIIHCFLMIYSWSDVIDYIQFKENILYIFSKEGIFAIIMSLVFIYYLSVFKYIKYEILKNKLLHLSIIILIVWIINFLFLGLDYAIVLPSLYFGFVIFSILEIILINNDIAV